MWTANETQLAKQTTNSAHKQLDSTDESAKPVKTYLMKTEYRIFAEDWMPEEQKFSVL